MKKLFGNLKAAAGSMLKNDSPPQSEPGSRSSSDSSSRGSSKGVKKGSKNASSTANAERSSNEGPSRDPSGASPRPRSSKPRASPSPRSPAAAGSDGSARGGHVPSSPSTPQGRQGSRRGRGTGSRGGRGTSGEEGAASDAADGAAFRGANVTADPTSDDTLTSSLGYDSSSDLPPGVLDGITDAADLQRGSDAVPDYSFDSEQSGSSKGGGRQLGRLESASTHSTETQALSVSSLNGSFNDLSMRSSQANAGTPSRREGSVCPQAERAGLDSSPGGTWPGNSRGGDSAQGPGRASVASGVPSAARGAERLRPAGVESVEGRPTRGGAPVPSGRASQGAAHVQGGAGRGGGGGAGTPSEAPELPLQEALEACEAEDEREQLRGLRSLRAISRGSKDARVAMVAEGVVGTMLRMQHSESEEVLTLALLVLLNVSCDDESAPDMGVTLPFVERALQHQSGKVRESAAAVVFSLSLHSFHRESLLASSAAASLVPILASGTDQGKRDCCKALFHLSYLPKSYKILIKAGAVEPAVDLLYPPDSKIAEKATCLLANIARCAEGCEAIAACPEGMPNLVEILNEGSPLAKEFAAAALLLIAQSHRQHRKSLMLESPFIALDGLQNTGSARAKLKASALLKLLGEQKEEYENDM